jgi:hypothetical protein
MGKLLVWPVNAVGISAGKTNSLVPNHQHRQVGMRQHLGRDAAQHQLFQPAPAVRAHDDEVGVDGFGGVQDAAVNRMAFDDRAGRGDAYAFESLFGGLDGFVGLVVAALRYSAWP